MTRALLQVSAFAVLACSAVAVHAQTPYITYYTPPVYAPATAFYPTAAAAPAIPYVAPSGYVRTTSYYAPAAPYYAPRTAYYGPSSPYYSYPAVTRYRPVLGTTVSRYVTGYAPSVYYSY